MTETLVRGYSSESTKCESFLMNTNITGFRCFKKNLCVLVLWTKIDPVLEGLILPCDTVMYIGRRTVSPVTSPSLIMTPLAL